MKKVIIFMALAAFLASCSQYTCPTYTKKDQPKRIQDTEQRI